MSPSRKFNMCAKLDSYVNLYIRFKVTVCLVLQINTDISSACSYINCYIHQSRDVPIQLANLIYTQSWNLV